MRKHSLTHKNINSSGSSMDGKYKNGKNMKWENPKEKKRKACFCYSKAISGPYY
jgi:hypothetical protein